MEDLTLLTMTGARPEAWAICETLMLRQTFTGAVRWIIVDDGPIAHPITFSRAMWVLEVVRPIPFWVSGKNTQARNIEDWQDNEKATVQAYDSFFGPTTLTQKYRSGNESIHVNENAIDHSMFGLKVLPVKLIKSFFGKLRKSGVLFSTSVETIGNEKGIKQNWYDDIRNPEMNKDEAGIPQIDRHIIFDTSDNAEEFAGPKGWNIPQEYQKFIRYIVESPGFNKKTTPINSISIPIFSIRPNSC